MFRIFKKREEVFHKLIQQQASITYEGVKLLVKYIETQSPEIAEELALKEKEADEIRRILIDELNRTFVTPFDREDIFALSRSIDDVIDYADSTVSEMVVLKVKPTPTVLEVEQNAMSFKKGETGLKTAVDSAVRAMVGDGTLTSLSKKWFGPTEDMAAEVRKLGVQ